MPFVLLALLAASPEVQVEPAGPVGLALGSTFRVRAASGPALTLVVWEAGGRLGIRAGSIHAARFSPSSSTSLDPEGLLVSAPLGSNPSVAWLRDLDAWAVVYEYDGVWLRLVRLDGTFHPATATPLLIGAGRVPRVASLPMGFAVTTEAGSPLLVRFSLPATPRDLTPVQLGTATLDWGSPVCVASTQTGPTAVWLAQQTLFRVDAPPMGAVPFPLVLPTTSVRRIDAVAPLASGVVVSGRLTTDAGLNLPRLVTLRGSSAQTLDLLPTASSLRETSVTAGLPDEAYVSVASESDPLTFWKYSDGGVVMLAPATVTTANAGAIGFDPAAGSMSAWSTYYDGVFARGGPLEGAPQPTSRQLGLARGGHVGANVAAWANGEVLSWQVVGGAAPGGNATSVARELYLDGGVAPLRALSTVTTRFDDLSVAGAGDTYATLSGTTMVLRSQAGPTVAVALPPSLVYPRVTTSRRGEFVVTGMLTTAGNEEGVVFQLDGGTLRRSVLFPASAPQPVRPRLAFDRRGSSGLAVINPAEELWGTRVTGDLVARDDGGFLITNSTAVDPEVVADEAGGFLVLSTDYDNVWVRRVVDAGLVDERVVLSGFWDLGSVVEVPGGALAMATSRTNGDVVAVTLSIDGGLVSTRQQAVATGLPHTNHAAVAVAADHVTFVFGRYDPDAGAPTTRFVQWARGGAGSTCSESWQCLGDLPCTGSVCMVPSVDAGGVDAGGVDAGGVDAGSTDAGSTDAGSIDAGSIDAGSIDAGSIDAGSIDAGSADAGSTDAGSADAGSADAGSIDAGSGAMPANVEYRAGCDCQQTGGVPLLVLAAVMLWRRRR